MPLLGLGLWKISKDVCAETVFNAIKAGYRLLDGACDYGNEKEVGEGIKRAITEGIVKREDLFVVSKLWNTFHAADKVEMACKKTLADLQLEYLDLYLIHFPIAQKFVAIESQYPPEWVHPEDKKMVLDNETRYEDTWHAMEALVNNKMARNIGCCNINTNKINDVLKYAKIKPSVLQVELHPFLT